jgi:hypothetical protein
VSAEDVFFDDDADEADEDEGACLLFCGEVVAVAVLTFALGTTTCLDGCGLAGGDGEREGECEADREREREPEGERETDFVLDEAGAGADAFFFSVGLVDLVVVCVTPFDFVLFSLHAHKDNADSYKRNCASVPKTGSIAARSQANHLRAF